MQHSVIRGACVRASSASRAGRRPQSRRARWPGPRGRPMGPARSSCARRWRRRRAPGCSRREAPGPGTAHDVTAKRPSALTSTDRLPQPASRIGREIPPSVDVDQMWLRGPDVVIPVAHRVTRVQHRRDLRGPCAAHAASRRRRYRRPTASDRAVTSVTSAARATCTALTPPGSSTTWTASPPAAGNRHRDGFGSSLRGTGEHPRRDEEQVAAGGEDRRRLSLDPAGEASRRTSPVGVELPQRRHVLGLLLVELADGRDDARPVGDTARPATRGRAR